MSKKLTQYVWVKDKKSNRKLNKLRAKLGIKGSNQPEIVLCFQSNVDHNLYMNTKEVPEQG